MRVGRQPASAHAPTHANPRQPAGSPPGARTRPAYWRGAAHPTRPPAPVDRALGYAGMTPVAVVEAYAELARRVLAGPARLGRTRMVAIDGPSGAGKSRFAAHLADALTALHGDARPPVVHTDDLLDGWDDQLTFWTRLEARVLAPLRAGRAGAYHRYSWVRRSFLPDAVPVPVGPVLIVEGVSAARAAARPELTLAVFVTAPAPLRLARAVARDGPEILPELRRWHAGESAHFAADGTAEHADLVVDGAPGLPHDRTRYYVRLG
ncbi:Uridine kinase [Micromonospora avicenniae]|uniref:Uridine kinase n=1 Tax=Micromonospora avicenniae TaxID=1198245 RepID=A0A1N7CXY9_9ACTN|nr:Uridine kinase [Micromonospora avicenniae]